MSTEVSVKYRVIPDEDPDASYLEQEGFEERLAAYRRDEFSYVGVRAVVEVHDWQRGTTATYESGGLWGIESDSGDEYFREVGAEELAALAPDLEAAGVDIAGITPVLGGWY